MTAFLIKQPRRAILREMFLEPLTLFACQFARQGCHDSFRDRICISHAAPEMRKEYGFDAVTMGWIFSAFNLSYSLLQIPGGWLGDKFGPRRVLTGIVLWWSAFTAATALSVGKVSMYGVRLLFGAGEVGAFPTATRALSLWLPARERGFAQGLTHSGARLGAALTPPLAVYLITSFGWRSVFYIFGALGAVWAASWYWYYRDQPSQHASVNEAELAIIQAGSKAKPVGERVQIPWGQFLRSGIQPVKLCGKTHGFIGRKDCFVFRNGFRVHCEVI